MRIYFKEEIFIILINNNLLEIFILFVNSPSHLNYTDYILLNYMNYIILSLDIQAPIRHKSFFR